MTRPFSVGRFLFFDLNLQTACLASSNLTDGCLFTGQDTRHGSDHVYFADGFPTTLIIIEDSVMANQLRWFYRPKVLPACTNGYHDASHLYPPY
jgi:hypothetical protein